MSHTTAALYVCPKKDGKRIGPLVPYAGKDGQGRNLVGDVYFNFAMIEPMPWIVDLFAKAIMININVQQHELAGVDAVIGIPDGGRTLGQALANCMRRRFIYPLKVPRPKSKMATKEEFDLAFKRISIEKDMKVLVCDDVHNNFQNTDDVLDIVVNAGAVVVGLASGLNRSPKWDSHYVPQKGALRGQEIPIVSAIRKKLDEFDQDDPAVAEDVQRGNIEPKVKENWNKLKALMAEHGYQVIN